MDLYSESARPALSYEHKKGVWYFDPKTRGHPRPSATALNNMFMSDSTISIYRCGKWVIRWVWSQTLSVRSELWANLSPESLLLSLHVSRSTGRKYCSTVGYYSKKQLGEHVTTSPCMTKAVRIFREWNQSLLRLYRDWVSRISRVLRCRRILLPVNVVELKFIYFRSE